MGWEWREETWYNVTSMGQEGEDDRFFGATGVPRGEEPGAARTADLRGAVGRRNRGASRGPQGVVWRRLKESAQNPKLPLVQRFAGLLNRIIQRPK